MKLLLECKDMDAAGELHNALKDNLLESEATHVGIVHDSSGHNWTTGWFVAIERSPEKEEV